MLLEPMNYFFYSLAAIKVKIVNVSACPQLHDYFQKYGFSRLPLFFIVGLKDYVVSYARKGTVRLRQA